MFLKFAFYYQRFCLKRSRFLLIISNSLPPTVFLFSLPFFLFSVSIWPANHEVSGGCAVRGSGVVGSDRASVGRFRATVKT
ncbi:hypothetical protein QQF64_013113 [Cirrhinus molitorella]|uniref:Uncharacterized protein n=1 Tax=Cirrhinus molitorella TaxID=172907 RepID=A0ABR3LQ86_9TELE